MLHIAVVDDDTAFSKGFCKQIKALFAAQQITCECRCFSEGGAFLKQADIFDVIFMDIDIPGFSGFEAAAHLHDIGSKAILLFVSSHDHFVYESFRYAPLRFLRKGHLEEELQEAVEAVCRKLHSDIITVENDQHIACTVELSHIAGFFAVRHDILLLYPDNTTMSLARRSCTMDSLEAQLKPFGFLRPHKSYLINYRYISRIYRERITLTDGGSIPMSRRKTSQIREQYSVLMRKETLS
ncbi:MAG: LytTR family DNA-binding domain-containing protein [Oscillospiraceae bacterium]|nr:LytTR family DNA-binding domain-containing protein [Oscillospiraceae bacterium]